MTAKPILKYPGAKWRLAPWIVPLLPPHQCYVEPFFGSGAIFFAKQPAYHEIINDLDEDVVAFFQVLWDQPAALAQAVALTPWSRREFDLALVPTDDAVERARRFLVRSWQGIGGRILGSTGWRRRNCAGAPYTETWNGVPERLLAVAQRLKHAEIECRPALEVIRQYRRVDVLLYVDPPYHLETRQAGLYPHEMTDEDHLTLLDALLDHPGPVVLSGYAHPLYDERLRSWQQLTRQARAERGGLRTEVVWINCPFARQQQMLEGARL